MTNRKKCAGKRAVKTCATQTHAEKTPGRIVHFKVEDAPGKQVFVAGTFNEWQLNTPMKDSKNDGVYTIRMRLLPGEYQYKFVIDGEWRLDNENRNFAPNGFGELNSVLKVEDK